jgi:heptosyltransferase-2
MNIVVRGTNWIGDAVMTVPALKSLRAALPDARITLFTRACAEGVFRDAGFIDRIITYTPTGSRRRDLGIQRRALSAESFDAALIFPNSFESALAAALARIGRRFGYAKEGRGFLLTDAFPVPDWKKERHEVHYYVELAKNAAERLGGRAPDVVPDTGISIAEERKQLATEMLCARGIDTTRKIAALGVGSANSTAKRWPAGHYAGLADLLTERLGAEVIILGAPEEAGVAGEVASLARRRTIVLSGQTDLAEAVAVLSVSDLLVSNDMGLAHLGPAVGVPTLVIFGPTDDRTTGPLGSEIIRKPFDCAPCLLRNCPIDHRCMTTMTPEEVYARVLSMIKGQN